MGTKPVGGFKIVYEYANRLSALGFSVTLIHTAWLYKSHPVIPGIVRYVYSKLLLRFQQPWFELDPKVKNKQIFTPCSFTIPDSDFIVATSWETAEHVNKFSISKGKKLYLIQAKESEYQLAIENNWQQRALATWALPMQKIVICTWLLEQVIETGNTAVKIYNGLNFNDFYNQQQPELRERHTIMMLYHYSSVKGCQEGLNAIRLVKTHLEGIKLILFGVPSRPAGLEDWIEYHQTPHIDQLRSLYNRSAIFLSPSHSEGWGLPVAEAMQCGCVVVTSDIGGFKDFVKDGQTGLCFKVKDIPEMASKLLQVLEDPALSSELKLNGQKIISQFTWERAVTEFSSLLNSFGL